MAKTSQRTSPSLEDAGRPRLVNLLCEWGLSEPKPLRADWAEQLALWLGPLDAITLQAAQQSVQTPPLARRAGGRADIALEADLRRVRDGLLHAMAHHAGSAEADFATYRQRYQEQQRRMDLMLGPFRSHCRGVLAQTSAELHQLADLDSAMEHTLGEREKALLARLPHWLERRFGQRKKEAAGEHGTQDWINRFEQDCQQLLLAELAFRLEPIEGLVQAFHNKAK